MPKTYRKVEKTYRPGEIIFKENSDCDGMYIINAGKVSVYKTLSTGDGVEEIELVQLGPKGMFGEMSLIDENKRSAAAKALETTKVTIITREMFHDQLSRLPVWVLTLIKLLVNRLRATNAKLQSQERILSRQTSMSQASKTTSVLDEDDDDDDEFEEDEVIKKPEIALEEEDDDDDDDDIESSEVNEDDTKEHEQKAAQNKDAAETDKLLDELDF
ncbi:MAG: cyclic nucleotide-binding domain-containing protein [Fibrobacteria bacterium]|nr:cyclic nucleotide-binding domain-containing protein [Fibrobacteria bacterium]